MVIFFNVAGCTKVISESVQGLAFEAKIPLHKWPTAIHIIPHQRKPQIGHMHPQLMRPAGVWG